MAFYNSPQVNVREQEAGVGVVETGDSVAATVFTSMWGPAEQPVQTTAGEAEIVRRYGKPNSQTYLGFFVATDYASYVSKVILNRLVGPNALNSVPNGMAPLLVKNDAAHDTTNLTGYSFIGKYPGTPGNNITIDIADTNKFPTWEYRSKFDYAPALGEYAVAIVDGSGYWTGSGAANQTEALTISGTTNGGVQQNQTLTFTGTAAGGTQQQETLTVSGTATDITIVVDGNTVAIAIGDTSTVVAGKIATVLAANNTKYASAVAVGSQVVVTFAVVGPRNPISTVNQSSITVASTINILGSTVVPMTIYGKSFAVTNGDIASVVAGKYLTALQNDPLTYTAVSSPLAGEVEYTYVAYGPQTTSASQTVAGMTIATTVNTAGSTATTISVFGTTVNLVNGDTSTVVATKIAAALLANGTFTTSYTNIQAIGSAVYYTWKASGAQTTKTAPTTQDNLLFFVTLKQVGTLGTLLEKYELLTNDPLAKRPDGSSAYFYADILANSNVVAPADKTYQIVASTITLNGAVDDNNVTVLSPGLTPFYQKETYNIHYVLAGHFDIGSQKAAISLTETRRDCVAYANPPLGAVLNVNGNEVTNIMDWNDNQLNYDSTYSSKQDNWALIYDAYNNVNRWIPTCGGDAGLHAVTTRDFEAWVPAAGLQRGRYKNYLRTAWNSSQNDRDILFPMGINSVVTFPGQGIVRWGDKTGTSRPSNFDGENVRWAFIVAESDIASFSKNYIFELNDPFTRTSFLRALDSYLQQMVRRGAFAEAKVIVDDRNNTMLTQSQHKLIGNILLRPVYSIRFIELTMTAVGGTLTLSEVESSILGSAN